jgi:hypothetical protein
MYIVGDPVLVSPGLFADIQPKEKRKEYIMLHTNFFFLVYV